MTELDKRIVAAHAVLADYLPPSVERIVVADKMCRAAFPELFTEPPQAWIAPWELTTDLKREGLCGLVVEIERLSGPMPKLPTDGSELSPEETAQRYMHLGAVTRGSLEVEAAYRAIRNAHLRPNGKPE